MTIVTHSPRRKNATIPYRINPALPGGRAEHNHIGIVCHVHVDTTKCGDAAIALRPVLGALNCRPDARLNVLCMRCRTGQVLAEFEPLRKRATE
jgi:hypothetical protein